MDSVSLTLAVSSTDFRTALSLRSTWGFWQQTTFQPLLPEEVTSQVQALFDLVLPSLADQSRGEK